jgi:hypothetical protein
MNQDRTEICQEPDQMLQPEAEPGPAHATSKDRLPAHQGSGSCRDLLTPIGFRRLAPFMQRGTLYSSVHYSKTTPDWCALKA